MIESENLLTASLYINNQLLSRGLLRDGYSINFADPGDTGGELAATMGRIMSVVNDLILRRDVSLQQATFTLFHMRSSLADTSFAFLSHPAVSNSATPSTASHCPQLSAPSGPSHYVR